MKNNDQQWRKLPVTKKQEVVMDELHIPFDPNMTRGEASDAITEELENAPHPFSEEAFNP